MKRRPRVLTRVGLLALLVVAPGATAAPPIQATARTARTTVRVGEPVRITIDVKDCEEMPRIDAPSVEGMNLSSSETAEVTPSAFRHVRPLSNGQMPNSKILASLRDLSKQLGTISEGMPKGADQQLTRQYQEMLKKRLGNLNRNDYSFVYLATPEKTGPIRVPSFTVHASGQTVLTQPLQLIVSESRPSPWAKAALSVSNADPIVGDTVNLHVDLLVRRWTQPVGRGAVNLKSQPINHVMLHVPRLEGYPEIQPLEPLDELVEKRRLPPGQLGYQINNLPGVILLEQEPTSEAVKLDPQWYRRRLTIPFRAVRAGEIEVPPLRVSGEVYVPTGGTNRYTWEGFGASSPPLKFHIRALPNGIGGRENKVVSQPPRVAVQKTPLVEGPSAIADGRSNLEQGSEESGGSWLAIIATIAAVVVSIFGVIRVVVVVYRRDAIRRQTAEGLHQRRQAVEQARQRSLTPPLSAADVAAAMQDFLRARLSMAAGEITPQEANEHLTKAGYPAELASRCAEVLDACAARQFAPSGTGGDRCSDLALAAERLMGEILAYQPKVPSLSAARMDGLTSERQAALDVFSTS